MSKYTSGKWEVENTCVYALQDCVWLGNPAKKNRFYCLLQSGGRDTASEEELKANARLMATAPELLEVCKDILDFLKSSGYDTRLVRQVIAKAEGK